MIVTKEVYELALRIGSHVDLELKPPGECSGDLTVMLGHLQRHKLISHDEMSWIHGQLNAKRSQAQ